jgi:hypothetical protein
MGETTFENAKVGDRVWSVEFGWGVVVDKKKDVFYVNFTKRTYTKENVFYSFDGKAFKIGKSNQTLFWDEIKIVPPERPKRKVVRNIERWVNVYPGPIIKTAGCYENRYEADRRSDPGRIDCVKLTGTYEVYE